MALVTGGAYAAVAAVPEAVMLPVPPGMSWTEAAAVPEAFLTAWHNLVDLGGVTSGETVLVHAGASGVGTAAIQLAGELGTETLAVAGTPEKAALCRALGARHVFDRREGSLSARVLDATAERGVDLVLDVVGAPLWDENLKVLRPGGRLVLIGFLGGSRGEMDLGPVLRKSLRVSGTTLRGKSLEEKQRFIRAFGDFALPRFQDKRLRPVVDRAFPLAEAGSAHAYMAANRNAGKIVLEIE
jgi:NADPH:quinone reductase-like Zn-dependent oxidoreductase